MTIRRRLFISNIMMIIVPLVVSIAVFYGGLYFFTSVTGLREASHFKGGRVFGAAVRDVGNLARLWSEYGTDLERMKQDVAMFNERYEGTAPYLLLYHGGVLATPDTGEGWDELSADVMASGASATFLGRIGIYTENIGENGEFKAVLRSVDHFEKGFPDYRDVMRMGMSLAVLTAIFVVMLTNRLLTRFVFDRIMVSLNTLSDGVHQIRDGNLGYRIDYYENDEFAPICEDFNTMAARLERSVEEGRRAEIDRRELIAGISHDLRTPLTSIKAYIEGIEKGVASTPEIFGRYVATIRDKSQDLERIIDTLFLFSKLDTGEFPYAMERVPLERTVSEIVGGLRDEYAARGLEISLDAGSLSPGAAYVEIDSAQLRNIMINAFENSVKYGKSNKKDNGIVKADVILKAEARWAEITLADDGPGVQEGSLERIFDVFYRGDPSRKEPGKGSGLGLAIAAKIVKHFGGTIEAKNVSSRGLAIIIRLPLCV